MLRTNCRALLGCDLIWSFFISYSEESDFKPNCRNIGHDVKSAVSILCAVSLYPYEINSCSEPMRNMLLSLLNQLT